MLTLLKWLAAIAAVWALILAAHQAGYHALPLNGLAYAALCMLALAGIGRQAKNWHPALARISALLGCAALAAVDITLSGVSGETGQKLFFAALLGSALTVMAARHAPNALRKRWLGN